MQKTIQTVTKDYGEAENKLFNFRPVFFVAVFLCLGIVFMYGARCYGLSSWWLLLWLPFIGVAVCFSRTKKRLIGTCAALVAFASAFASGAFLFERQVADFAEMRAYYGETVVAGRVIGKERANAATRVYLTDLNVDGNRAEGQLVAYLPRRYYTELALSDTLLLTGEIDTDVALCGEYGFRAGEIREKAAYRMTEVESCEITGEKFDLFLRMRQRAERVIVAGMDETPAAVTLAVLFGQTSGIDRNLLTNIRYGGIAHIFAVSGLHVGALFGFCLLLMHKTRLRKTPKPVRFLLVCGLLLFYAGICGFSASVLRATVICLTGYFAALLRTKTDFLQALGAAAIFILLIDPVALLEVGFQLSFLSCLGIALLSRPLRLGMDAVCAKIVARFPKRLSEEEREALENGDTLPPSIPERIRKIAVNFLAVSLATQIFTAPVCLRTFGYFSAMALLLNVIFVPLISGIFAVLLSAVTVACALPVAFSGVLLYVFNTLLSFVLLLFEAMDFSKFALTGLKISVGGCITYYGCCVFCTDKWNLSKRWKFAFATLFAVAFALTVIAGKM
ncbi:MAG: ComEC/Rec2 family competence protein [Clostridia bacterium]|nr:ComEC/Rec2 family competence protein [Clostridia bacterium]